MPDYTKAPGYNFDLVETVADLQRRLVAIEQDRSGSYLADGGADGSTIQDATVVTTDVSTYDGLVAADSPLGWWPMADPSGSTTAADASGNGNDAAASNVTFGVVGPIAQNAGETGALFDGSTSQMLSPLSPTEPVITLEGWINLNNSVQTGNPVLIGNSNPAVDHVGYRMYLNAGVAPAVIFGNGTTSTTVISPTNVPGKGWTYLVATWDGSTVALYMNGTLVAQGSLSGSLSQGTGAGTGLGYDPVASGSFFHGSMGHFSVTPVALPGTEIANRYTQGLSPVPNSPGGQITYKQAPQPLNVNGTFDGQDDTQPWQGQHGASVVTTQSGSQLFGTNTMLITPDGTTLNPGATSELCLIAPAVQYSVSMWTISQQGWSAVQVGMNWYDQYQNFISQTLGTSYPLAATIGTLAAWTAYAPINAMYAQIVVQMTGTPTSTTTLEIDTAYLTRGTTPISQIVGQSMSPVSGYDQYGNAIPAGANLTIGQILGELLVPGSVDASKVVIAGTIVGSLMAANSITAGMIAAGAIDGLTINGISINGQTISAADIIISGTNGGLFTYGSGGTTVETHIYGSAGSAWVAPNNVTVVTVELWGGGAGGGGNGGAQYLISGGGGGGGQYVKYNITVTPGNSYSFHIGGPGGGGGYGADGGDGGNTWFGAITTAQAAGGSHGNGGNSGANGGHGGNATPPVGAGATLLDSQLGGHGGDGKSNGPVGGGGGAGSGAPGIAGRDGLDAKTSGYSAGGSAQPDGGPGGRGGGINISPFGGQAPSIGPGGGGGGGGGGGQGGHNGGAGFGGQVRLTYTPSATSIMVSIAGSPGTDPISGESFPAGIMVDAINAPSVAADPINGGAETWHQITLDSGWTTNSPNTTPQYKLMPDKTIMIEGYCTHAAFTASVTLNSSNPLPTPYRPLSYHHAAIYSNVAGNVLGLYLDPSGVIHIEAVAGSTTTIKFAVRFALDC